jgi:hypothetical protein
LAIQSFARLIVFVGITLFGVPAMPVLSGNETIGARMGSFAEAPSKAVVLNLKHNQDASVTQRWKVAQIKMVKVSTDTRAESRPRVYTRMSVYSLTKSVPTNALKPDYTPEMVESDRYLAQLFAGAGAVAAANGFEPIGLPSQYPIYRGDLLGTDGRIRRGHLSYAMHLYGSADGTGTTTLYVPEGFTSHSNTPTPSDAAITFYYPRIGNLTNVTMAVFHIANFTIARENGRVRIGEIGGRGGSYQYYRHSHIEFYRGNVGLPSGSRRAALRIDPALVFRTDLRNIATNVRR